jgi:creatinine amidohydrolase/Fe(II)-dependent formamide hydrolase-like protein
VSRELRRGAALRGGGDRTQEDPLGLLEVIDGLDVGPVEVEPRRLSMPYVVRHGGQSHRTELIYKFEEEVFDRGDAGCRNLAAMIGVQPALNYGLFCREIVFHDALDDRDRAFIDEFARNTAREIYVNKFLLPNPFLVGAAARLPVVRRESYLRARLRFPQPSTAALAPWSVDRSRHAVLSSGGKDSLLSYGLLDELDRRPQTVFVNESGRHWYTALNAYRHFAASRPPTHRVWTNSDRLFTWMLRHLPFIRPDFARVRSDEYPIRLWTVAVFLFGALPLLRRHGIARLLIGDEFDTTVRRTFKGIPHHAGLYDQSRFFDNAMTRYFLGKGWGVCQFSILRPLSELLIEKLLVERYPALQQLQMSCHAASLRGERGVPCGRCEKCRRIVGMQVAIGGDPRDSGYTSQQIDACLAALAEHGVHQEAAGAQHLVHLLRERGRLPPSAGGAAAEPHPEVLQLRFHPEASPFDTVPNDLREGLHRTLLQHAAGAVERQGRIWVPCDALAPARLAAPYPFEGRRGRQPAETDGGAARAGGSYRLAEMTWKEAEIRFQQTDIALLPVGAVEQHGPHLPLDVDAFDADHLARRVAAACRSPQPLVLPVIPYGVSYHHEDFAGTFSISPETLARFVYEVGLSAARNGITKLVVINGHGGNGPALHLAAQMIDRDARIFTCVDTGETSDADIYELLEADNDIHAGEIETSTTLATRPELVKMELAPKMVPRFSSRYLNFTSRPSVAWYARTAKISPTGVLGDATKASREKGEKIWSIMTRRLVEFVEDLQGLSLDEIYERRY